MNASDKRITQSTLLNMGWTKAMIQKLLPDPDLAPNPHYKKAAPMKLYSEELVIEVMNTDEYKTMLQKAIRRKASAKNAIKTKTENLIKNMESIGDDIYIKIIPEDELIQTVLDYYEQRIKYRMEQKMEYNYRHMKDGNEFREAYDQLDSDLECFAFHKPNDATLNRWVVNYIRHNLIDYDYALHDMHGKVGQSEGYTTFKKQILKKISSVYPKYADECQRQINNMKYCFPQR